MNIDPKTIVDADAILERMLYGKRLDPEVYRRVREEGERITEEIRRKHGTVDIAVDLIHESRDE